MNSRAAQMSGNSRPMFVSESEIENLMATGVTGDRQVNAARMRCIG